MAGIKYVSGRYTMERSDSHVYARAKSLCDNLGCYLDHVTVSDDDEQAVVDCVIEDLIALRQLLVTKLSKN